MRFARKIGVDRSSAYELLKLHPLRDAILTRCRSERQWPGWKVCLGWFRGDGDDDGGEVLPTDGEQTPTPKRHDEWGTPQELFDHYDRKFKFTIDVAASEPLAKCADFFSEQKDGLKQAWSGVVWMNPPVSMLEPFCKKAYETAKQGTTVVGLLPTFTESRWFRMYASHGSIELLRGRLRFQGGKGYAPFSFMVVVWRQKSARRGNRLSVRLSDHRLGAR